MAVIKPAPGVNNENKYKRSIITRKKGRVMKRKIKFLILEDVLTDLELVLMELEKAQLEFTYLHVETEKDFIKGLHEFKPDLIL